MADSGFNLPQVTVSEVDGTPRRYAIQELEFQNGSVTVSGNKATINGSIAIGGAISGGTTGSVLFINPTNTLAQDNANFFYDDTLNALFLGTASSGFVDNGVLNLNGNLYFKSLGTEQSRYITSSSLNGDDNQDSIFLAGGANPGSGTGNGGHVYVIGGNSTNGTSGSVYIYGGTGATNGDQAVYLAHTGGAVRGSVLVGGTTATGRMTVHSGANGTIALAVAGTASQTNDVARFSVSANISGISSALRFYSSTNGFHAYSTSIGSAGSLATPAVQITGLSCGIYSPSANKLGIVTNSLEAITIDSSQRVGIGITSPAFPLDVKGQTNILGKITHGYIETTVTSLSKAYDLVYTVNAGATAVSASMRALSFVATATGSGGGSGDLTGLQASAQWSQSSGTITEVDGLSCDARNTGAGLVSACKAYAGIVIASSTGNITDGRAFHARTPTMSSSGVIVTNHGVVISNQSLTGMTTSYGLRIGDQLAGAGTVYAISLDSTSGTTRNGIWFGGDAVIYRRAADILALASGDSFEVPANFAVGTTIDTTTSVTANNTSATSGVTGVNSVITMTSSTITDRSWGLRFQATQTGSANYSSSLGTTGFEGLAINAGSGTSEGVLGGAVYTRNSGSGTLVRATGLLILANENTGAGSVTNSRELDISIGPTITANNQTRIGLRFGIAPDPGSFTGTTSCIMQINSTVTGIRSAIIWGTSASATSNIYSSATNTLKTDGSWVVGTNLTANTGTSTFSTLAGALDAGGATSFEIPNGAGGTTVDATGEICVDSTSRTVNFYDGTAEVVLDPLIEHAFFLEAPTATDDFPVLRVDKAMTLVKTVYAITGGTNWVGQLQEADDAQGTGAADTQAADSTVTGTTTVTSYSNASFDAGDYIRLKTTSVSGVVTWLHVTFYFRINP